jgi:DNA primase
MSFDASYVDVEHYLESLGVRNLKRASETEWSFSCPMPDHPGSDENPSAYMNSMTGLFQCFSCKAKGNIVQVTSILLDVSHLEATRLLKEAYMPGYYDPDERDTVKEVKKIMEEAAEREEKLRNHILFDDTKDSFYVDWHYDFGSGQPYAQYMEARGFEEDALQEWELGYDERSRRITIPVRDEKGNLVGFKGRAWEDYNKPKYLILGDRPGKVSHYGWTPYHVTEVLFGAHRFEHQDQLIIMEGELNVVACYQKTRRNAVALNGSNFSDKQAEIVKSKTESVVTFLDSDLAGKLCTEKIIEKLSPYMPVYVVPDHVGDAATMDASTIERTIDSAHSQLEFKLFN